MIQKRYITGVILLLCLLASSLSAESDSRNGERAVPLPVSELSEVLSSWWTHAGFDVKRVQHDTNTVRLLVSRGDAACRFDISPRSALAARIQTTLTDDSAELSEAMERWRHYLSVYVNEPAEEQPPAETPPAGSVIPVSILSKIESVVCIRIATGEEKEQFSGVIVDEAGLVISVAHGLPSNPEIIVTLYDGRELPGALIRRDIDQDLALIQIPGPALQSVSLVNGRNLLGMGERVFSIGCVGDLQGTVSTGMINGPPRRVDGQPLWQVHMEVHPGNSGSPVFDSQGSLVALVKGRYRGTSTVGFLIPLETVIHFLKESFPS